jgi:hypothetical protein
MLYKAKISITGVVCCLHDQFTATAEAGNLHSDEVDLQAEWY